MSSQDTETDQSQPSSPAVLGPAIEIGPYVINLRYYQNQPQMEKTWLGKITFTVTEDGVESPEDGVEYQYIEAINEEITDTRWKRWSSLEPYANLDQAPLSHVVDVLLNIASETDVTPGNQWVLKLIYEELLELIKLKLAGTGVLNQIINHTDGMGKLDSLYLEREKDDEEFVAGDEIRQLVTKRIKEIETSKDDKKKESNGSKTSKQSRKTRKEKVTEDSETELITIKINGNFTVVSLSQGVYEVEYLTNEWMIRSVRLMHGNPYISYIRYVYRETGEHVWKREVDATSTIVEYKEILEVLLEIAGVTESQRQLLNTPKMANDSLHSIYNETLRLLQLPDIPDDAVDAVTKSKYYTYALKGFNHAVKQGSKIIKQTISEHQIRKQQQQQEAIAAAAAAAAAERKQQQQVAIATAASVTTAASSFIAPNDDNNSGGSSSSSSNSSSDAYQLDQDLLERTRRGEEQEEQKGRSTSNSSFIAPNDDNNSGGSSSSSSNSSSDPHEIAIQLDPDSQERERLGEEQEEQKAIETRPSTSSSSWNGWNTATAMLRGVAAGAGGIFGTAVTAYKATSSFLTREVPPSAQTWEYLEAIYLRLPEEEKEEFWNCVIGMDEIVSRSIHNLKEPSPFHKFRSVNQNDFQYRPRAGSRNIDMSGNTIRPIPLLLLLALFVE